MALARWPDEFALQSDVDALIGRIIVFHDATCSALVQRLEVYVSGCMGAVCVRVPVFAPN